MGAGVNPGLSSPVPLRTLAADVELGDFRRGESSLDDWLRKHARSAEGKSARSYVVRSGERVVGYYCIATGAIERASLPRKHRHGWPNPVPVFVLGRLAVDLSLQGKGLGGDLVADCFRRCAAAASIVGAAALVVHPLNDRLVPFYHGLGFVPLAGDSQAMFILTETIMDALAAG